MKEVSVRAERAELIKRSLNSLRKTFAYFLTDFLFNVCHFIQYINMKPIRMDPLR